MITALVVTALSGYGLYVVGSEAGTGGFAFVLTTTLVSFGGAFFVGDKLRQALPDSLFHVSNRMNRIAKALGVDHFNRFLHFIRWNRVALSLRPQLGTRQPADELLASVRSNAVAHTWGAAVHLVASSIAALASLPAALWIFGLGLLLHVYPVLLQVRTHWRLQRLQELSRSR